MKIGILGGGISGLSIAKMLSEYNDVEILEALPVSGGIARTRNVDDIAFHVTGGHCFNSKHREVLDWVFNKIMPENQWNRIERVASIRFKGKNISYPIEFAIKEIFDFDSGLAMKIVKDFLNVNDDNIYDNLDEWFKKKFGNTLAEEYFIPYNTKIWNKKPRDMNPIWVEGKLPIPNVESFFSGLFIREKDKMPHSSFYYPKSNNQNDFIEKLASGLNIKFNIKVNSIYIDSNKKYIINDQFKYDILISTLPLNILPSLLSNCPERILEAASNLEYNKVTTVLWESLQTENSWTYLPDSNIIFHRYIHIGNFFSPKRNFTITEAIGDRSYYEMLENGKKDPFLIKPLDYHVSNHAYVVYNEGFKNHKQTILNYLSENGIFTLGRFGEWEYYNMDICIKSALDLSKNIMESKIIL
jgi:protoporphyrinogen oxidase